MSKLRKVKQIGQRANWNSTIISLPLTLCYPTVWTLWSASKTIFYQHENIRLTHKITRQNDWHDEEKLLMDWLLYSSVSGSCIIHTHIQGLTGHSRVISPLLTCSLLCCGVPPVAVPVPELIHWVFKDAEDFRLFSSLLASIYWVLYQAESTEYWQKKRVHCRWY